MFIVLTLTVLQSPANPPAEAALGISPFPDSEVSTNVAFSAASSLPGEFRYAFTFGANASNNVQIAFGTDADQDGALDLDETDLTVGWRCGAWIARDRSGRLLAGEPASATNVTETLACRVRLGADGGPLSWGFSDSGGPVLTGAPAPFDSRWNMFRLTARGAGAENPSVRVRLLADGLHVILN